MPQTSCVFALGNNCGFPFGLMLAMVCDNELEYRVIEKKGTDVWVQYDEN